MQISKINLSGTTFGAIIGPNLQEEIRNKRKLILKTGSNLGDRELKRINNAEAKIKELLPTVYGSPVSVDIGAVYTKQFKDNKWVASKFMDYIIKNEDETFYHHIWRGTDENPRTFRYRKLIDYLTRLEDKFNTDKTLNK